MWIMLAGYLMREIEVPRNVAETQDKKNTIVLLKAVCEMADRAYCSRAVRGGGGAARRSIAWNNKKIQLVYHFYHTRSMLYIRTRVYFPGEYCTGNIHFPRVRRLRRRKDAKSLPLLRNKTQERESFAECFKFRDSLLRLSSAVHRNGERAGEGGGGNFARCTETDKNIFYMVTRARAHIYTLASRVFYVSRMFGLAAWI